MSPNRLSNLMIVVVDDHIAFRRYLGVFLGDRGAKVVTARDGFEGLEAIKKIHPDLVLSDIKMPGMEGFEVLAWIRQQWEFFQLCVVMLTSSDHIRDVNEAYHLGANSFLVKPLDFENAGELVGSLDVLLAKVKH